MPVRNCLTEAIKEGLLFFIKDDCVYSSWSFSTDYLLLYFITVHLSSNLSFCKSNILMHIKCVIVEQFILQFYHVIEIPGS